MFRLADNRILTDHSDFIGRIARLVNAPAIEAAELVEKLAMRDARLGLALTSLRKFIRVSESQLLHTLRALTIEEQEEQFANEFLQRDGLHELIQVINTAHGNILAVRGARSFSFRSIRDHGHMIAVRPDRYAELDGA